MKKRFRITYEVVTADSDSNGAAPHRGFLPKSGVIPTYRDNMPKNPALFTLRQAVEMLQNSVTPVEADLCPIGPNSAPRWLTARFSDTPEGSESISVHVDNVSDASARRIARLVNCYGLR